MFLHLMNDAQKLEFLKLARQMIGADEVVLDSEKAYLYRLFREAGLPANERRVADGAIADPAVFDTRRARVAVAVEALVLAWVDGEFDNTEKNIANDLIARLDINDTDREEVHQAAEKIAGAIALVKKLTA